MWVYLVSNESFPFHRGQIPLLILLKVLLLLQASSAASSLEPALFVLVGIKFFSFCTCPFRGI